MLMPTNMARALTLPALASEIGVSRMSVHRWATTGRRRPDGTVVRLRTIRIGLVRATTRTWYEQFRRACRPMATAKHGL
jgi:hypothetical protein